MSDLARDQAERLLAALERAAQLYPDDAGATLPQGVKGTQATSSPGVPEYGAGR